MRFWNGLITGHRCERACYDHSRAVSTFRRVAQERGGRSAAIGAAAIGGSPAAPDARAPPRGQVTLKKDPVQLSFALAGVRTPLRAQQASAGRPATQDEPHCHEALALTRRLVLQRDVELDVRPPFPRARCAWGWPGGPCRSALQRPVRQHSAAAAVSSAAACPGRLRVAVVCTHPCDQAHLAPLQAIPGKQRSRHWGRVRVGSICRELLPRADPWVRRARRWRRWTAGARSWAACARPGPSRSAWAWRSWRRAWRSSAIASTPSARPAAARWSPRRSARAPRGSRRGPPGSAPAPFASVWGGPAAASGQWCLRS